MVAQPDKKFLLYTYKYRWFYCGAFLMFDSIEILKQNLISDHMYNVVTMSELPGVAPMAGGGPSISLQDCVSSCSWDSAWLSSPWDILFLFVLMSMVGCTGRWGAPKSSISGVSPAGNVWWATWEKQNMCIYKQTANQTASYVKGMCDSKPTCLFPSLVKSSLIFFCL